jgi:fucose 4-O-acetylase-like acetyltransferase
MCLHRASLYLSLYENTIPEEPFKHAGIQLVAPCPPFGNVIALLPRCFVSGNFFVERILYFWAKLVVRSYRTSLRFPQRNLGEAMGLQLFA